MPEPGGPVAQLEREILTARAEQLSEERQLEAAQTKELRDLAAVDQDRAVQARCKRRIDQYVESIGLLQDELAAQREA